MGGQVVQGATPNSLARQNCPSRMPSNKSPKRASMQDVVFSAGLWIVAFGIISVSHAAMMTLVELIICCSLASLSAYTLRDIPAIGREDSIYNRMRVLSSILFVESVVWRQWRIAQNSLCTVPHCLFPMTIECAGLSPYSSFRHHELLGGPVEFCHVV